MEYTQPQSILSRVEEFEVISARMDDTEVNEIMEQVIKMIANPDTSAFKAPAMVVKLEAMATKFAILATYYSSFEKGHTGKKNMYYTLKEKTKDLADAVKYLAR